MTASTPLSVGEPAPWFSAAEGLNRSGGVLLDELAGRHIVLFFFGTAVRPDVVEALAWFSDRDDLFDDKRCLLLGISNDPDDFREGRLGQSSSGRRMLLDLGGVVTRQYLSAPVAGKVQGGGRPIAFVLSPALQIVGIVELAESAAFVAQIASVLNEQLAISSAVSTAPALVVPRVFDRSFCHQLIELYERAGGREIGSIEHGGQAVEQFDPRFRKRSDFYISDEATVNRTRELLERRLLPMVNRAFQFRTTRIERYLVGCYDAATGGYFRPHRDNTAPVVAHRRFAVTINLNDDYVGGNLRFPEFGYQAFQTEPGAAIVFSCSLLHEVTPVTESRRYAFLSFLYDEQAQQMRDEHKRRWVEGQKAGNS